MAKAAVDILQRVADWPAEAQAELRQIAVEMETQLHRGVYIATPAELAGIDRGIAAADRGELVELHDIERLIEKRRPK